MMFVSPEPLGTEVKLKMDIRSYDFPAVDLVYGPRPFVYIL